MQGKYFFIFPFLLFAAIIDLNGAIIDSKQDTVILSNISEFLAYKDRGIILLRTYNIKYTFIANHLDTTDKNTIAFLDSLANILLQRDIKSINVLIHLSIKYSSERTYNFSHMYEEIISYLVSKNVRELQMSGYNYLGEKPIIDCFAFDNKDLINDCLKTEYKINQRVEFLIEFE